MKGKLLTVAVCLAVIALVVRNNSLFTLVSGVTL